MAGGDAEVPKSGSGRNPYDFESALVEFYDVLPGYAGREDVRFYVDLALEVGGPVLELGCGTGRVLIPIARSGVSITGVDGSAGVLARCRSKLYAEPPGVRARVTPM